MLPGSLPACAKSVSDGHDAARMKRLFDLAGAALGLCLLAVPMLCIALAVRFDSPGPVFFRQQRVGRHGQLFRIHKFRTMHVQPEGAGPQITANADSRITRVGRRLRRWKLDELPQLLDVLAGNMSLVGPRPEVPRYVAHYPEAVRELVLGLRPGITDRASIEFRDEGRMLDAAEDPERCYLEQILPVKLGYYAEYARNHSLAGDLRILFETLAVLFGRRR